MQVTVTEDPAKLALLARIAVAAELIAKTLAGETVDPAAIAALTARLSQSTDALADAVATHPVPSP